MFRICLASIFIGVSTLITLPKVQAKDVEVEFSGIVESSASVEPIPDSPVNLSPSGNSLNIIEVIDPIMVRVNTNSPLNVKVSAPSPVDFVDPPETQYTGFLSYNGTEVQQESIVNITQRGNVDLGVRIKVVRPQAFPAGNYTYRLQLTMIPQ
ncbi:hypothetical protein [Nostoc sp. FACHB-145]|uniref:hypothetical protein n=1 Tax=Nostoc sp. FACHB-145 TaxID=2692836 RepID=UPI0016865632|nr:hypothetical protein [Nostoc sp. FACHB-145]